MLAVLLFALTLTAPVPGGVVREFDYGPDPFARGRHRGIDLAAAPGDPVRAACAGRAVAAGRVAGVGVVSLSCGGHRVSHLPVARIAVGAGDSVTAGAGVGLVAAGHRGLHLGVRREGDPFGYRDPAPLLARGSGPPAPPVVRAPRRGPRPLAREPGRVRPPRAPAPVAAPPPRPALAPWPAFAGLGLATAGLVTGGVVRRRRRAAARGRPRVVTAKP